MAISSATPTISSAGIGSGLDVNSIVTQLMNVEKLPLQTLQSAASKMQTQLSAFGQVQSLVSALHDAMTPLLAASSYNLTNSTSSDPSSVGVGSSATANPGSYSVSVSSLAASQVAVSASGQFANTSATVGSGSLTLRLGTWNAGNTSFSPATGSTDVSIAITASDTLAGIRDKINAANAGVTASLVTDASGARLALQSTATGAANGFRLTATDADGDSSDASGLSRLAFDPASGVNQLTITQSAANAQATVNGISVSSATNQLSDVVQGMSFSLSKVTTSPVSVSVTRNTDALKTMVTSVVSAYNVLARTLTQATAYNATTKQAALLQGNSTVQGIQNQMRSLVSRSGLASSVFSTLSAVGVEYQKDGTLKVNDTKLSAAVGNLSELQKTLSRNDGAGANTNGFITKLSAWTDSLLATSGTLPSQEKSIQSRIAANSKDQDRLNAKLALVEQRMKAQYTALDSTMSNANALSKYVTQQITTWNKSTA
jgi:flagellar hook-associated protein 2